MSLRPDARFMQQIQPRSRYPSSISSVPNKPHQLRKIAPRSYSPLYPPVSVAQRALAIPVRTHSRLKRHGPRLGSPLKKVRFADDPAPVEPEERSDCSESFLVHNEGTQKKGQPLRQSIEMLEGRISRNTLATLRLYARK
jgi:hypothetical protein